MIYRYKSINLAASAKMFAAHHHADLHTNAFRSHSFDPFRSPVGGGGRGCGGGGGAEEWGEEDVQTLQRRVAVDGGAPRCAERRHFARVFVSETLTFFFDNGGGGPNRQVTSKRTKAPPRRCYINCVPRTSPPPDFSLDNFDRTFSRGRKKHNFDPDNLQRETFFEGS